MVSDSNMPGVSADQGTAQAERLEWMKSEFLTAQQRRRDKIPEAASRSGDADKDPPQTSPTDETPIGIAAVQP